METAPYLLSIRDGKKPILGIMHIGALRCDECNDYKTLGAERVLWFEGNPESVKQGKEVLIKNSLSHNNYVIQAYLSHYDGQETFYETKLDSRNDSLLKPCTWYDDISEKNAKSVNVSRLDSLLNEDLWWVGIEQYNTLVIDVQGAELKVLAGAGDLLNHMDYIVCEAWHDELEVFGKVHYDNEATITRLRDFLDIFGFKETHRTPREDEDPTHSQAWVDILFERNTQ